MKRHIPNALTCINLLCGCLALSSAFEYREDIRALTLAAYLVGIAAVADFLDGMVARALRVSSPIGKDLDSLADMVSFGVVPGAILSGLLVKVLNDNILDKRPDFFPVDWPGVETFLPIVGFTVTIFSALRLAKFNNDTRQTTSFIGLPTPACTLVVASLPLILANDQFGVKNIILNPWFLLGLTILLSGLLVAELPLFALKFKNLKWVGNRRRFIFVAPGAGAGAHVAGGGNSLAVLLYVLLSVPGRVRSREGLEASPGAPQ